MHARRLITDKKFLEAYMEELLPRLNDMRVRGYTAPPHINVLR